MEIDRATTKKIISQIKSDSGLRKELAETLLDEILRNPTLSELLTSFIREAL